MCISNFDKLTSIESIDLNSIYNVWGSLYLYAMATCCQVFVSVPSWFNDLMIISYLNDSDIHLVMNQFIQWNSMQCFKNLHHKALSLSEKSNMQTILYYHLSKKRKNTVKGEKRCIVHIHKLSQCVLRLGRDTE